jgi:hypothetical protein
MDDPNQKIPRPFFVRESEPGSPRGGHSLHWSSKPAHEYESETEEQLKERTKLVDIMREIERGKRKTGRMNAKNRDRRNERQAG